MSQPITDLPQLLRIHHDLIRETLVLGYARWDNLVDRVQELVGSTSVRCNDEQLWTFLLACGYASVGDRGVRLLTGLLTGNQDLYRPGQKIWFEVLPASPRKREGETHLDLALGTIKLRHGTESGVGLCEDEGEPWVAFCEMKWLSDIAAGVTHDFRRNQLARVIENALCFGSTSVPDPIIVNLVTPATFMNGPSKCRLFQYKFAEYAAEPAAASGRHRHANSATICADLDACRLSRAAAGAQDARDRMSKLLLGWLSYDELFTNLPQSPVSDAARSVWNRFGNLGAEGATASSDFLPVS